ncbi:hypothetical protein Ddye_009093 [Dipteronia dyeriana]|uniref:RNase H type-1 domain-containing protein n=1 Tax=Dipteronia dyeriana TaxID=168575 RepID=A0AAD9XAQ4_9ROSI|nr:hypothetical protein Ddye_009093 [Dipteronia dyeriana]
MDMLKGAVFDSEGCHVSHLQFADDTILFLRPKVGYVENARRILRCFDLASGLRINFHKSCLMKVGKIRDEVINWSDLFRCPSVSLPIPYLGLSLGGRPSIKCFWLDMLHRVETRLAPWKKKFLNKGAYVDAQLPITTEVLAIAKAIDLCASNQELQNMEMVFESDSKTVVSWITGGGVGSVDHVQLIFSIRNSLNNFSQARVVFKPRTFNSVADLLAKSGAGGVRNCYPRASHNWVFWLLL